MKKKKKANRRPEEGKRSTKESDCQQGRTRVYIGDVLIMWKGLKDEKGLRGDVKDTDIALFLLDW